MDPIKIRAYKNKYKTAPNHPGWKGKFNGKEIAVWESDDGEYLSVSLQDETEREGQPGKPRSSGRYSNLEVSADDSPF